MSSGRPCAYCIDTSVFIDLRVYYDPAVFPTLWGNLHALVSSGRLFTPEHVVHEVLDPPIIDWISAHPGLIRPFDAAQNHNASTLASGSMQFGNLHGSWLNLCNVLQTDGAGSGAGEAVVRAYVRGLVRNGWFGGNYHHGLQPITNRDLLYFLDECKVWSDRGMLDVLPIRKAWNRIASARLALAMP